MKVAPCKGCQDKHPCCHATCDSYNTWKDELEKVKEAKRKYEHDRYGLTAAGTYYHRHKK